MISYRGTDKIPSIDIFQSDKQLLIRKIPSQYYVAYEQYRNVINQYPKSKITFTGHSLGASISNLMAYTTGHNAVGFSPFGVKDIMSKHSDIFNKSPKVVNYGRMSDWVFKTNLKNQAGNVYLLPDLPQKTYPLKAIPISPFGAVAAEGGRQIKSHAWEQHVLDNYPSLNTAVPYKQTEIEIPYKIKSQNFSSESMGVSNSYNVAEQLIKTLDPTQIVIPVLPVKMPTPSVFGAVMNMVTPLVTLAATVGLVAKANLHTGVVEKSVGNTSVSSEKVNQMMSLLSTYNASLNGIESTYYHSGGVVPGEGEVMAILKGGETARTKAQEEELQERLYKNAVPVVCGEPQNSKEMGSNTKEHVPLYQQISRDDESFIINLIADAIDRNRLGLRAKLQAL